MWVGLNHSTLSSPIVPTSSDVPDPMRQLVPHEAEAVESCCLMHLFRSWETAAATQCAQTARTDLIEKKHCLRTDRFGILGKVLCFENGGSYKNMV